MNEMIQALDPHPTLARLAEAPTAKRKPLDGMDVEGHHQRGQALALEFGHFGTVIPAIFRPAGPRKQSPGFSLG